MLKKTFVLIVISALLFCWRARSSLAENLIIVTASPGGTYYPVGVGVGTLITIKLAAKHKIMATAITSAGSVENILMLRNKEAHLATLQSFHGLAARRSKGVRKGKPVGDFLAVTMLWENVDHFIINRKYVKTGNIDDMRSVKGRFSAGKRGSGSESSTLAIFETLGIKTGKNFDMERLGYGASAQAMMDRRLTGMNAPAGPPAAAVTRLFAQLGAKNIKILEFTDRQLEKIAQKYPVWNRYIIKPGTYPGQKNAVKTISQGNFLAVRSDISVETVYLITRTIYENLPFLANIHKIVKDMDVNKAVAGLPVPLHPGAAKYYKEKGVTIPENLRPEVSDDSAK